MSFKIIHHTDPLIARSSSGRLLKLVAAFHQVQTQRDCAGDRAADVACTLMRVDDKEWMAALNYWQSVHPHAPFDLMQFGKLLQESGDQVRLVYAIPADGDGEGSG